MLLLVHDVLKIWSEFLKFMELMLVNPKWFKKFIDK